MMIIGNVQGTNNSMRRTSGIDMTTDSVSRNIQNQIAEAQKRLQELSTDDKLTLEEKMKKRQEIQQEISMLNQQLRQHQIERRKEQQEKSASANDMPGGGRKAAREEKNSGGFIQAGMEAMISADFAMKQAKVHGSVAAQTEGKAGVLESEIKMDKGRGSSTEKKEEELADLQAKAQAAQEAQISKLADAGREMEEATTEQDSERAEGKETDKAAKKADKTTANDAEGITAAEAAKAPQAEAAVPNATMPETAPWRNRRISVDVRL